MSLVFASLLWLLQAAPGGPAGRPQVTPGNGGFSARSLASAPRIDGREWVPVTASLSGSAGTAYAPDNSFLLTFREVDGDTGDVARCQLLLARPGQESIQLKDLASWAYVTPDSRYVFFEPLNVLDVRQWRVFALSDALGIRNYTSIEAISRDGRRLLVSRIERPQDCHCEPEYYELVLPK